MKPWHRLTLATVLGLAAGASLAVYRVRGGLSAGQITNGPWATAKTYGSTDADARWWSLTLYRGEGWLVPNAANRWSVGSSAVQSDAWTITVAPDPAPGQWLPTGGVAKFDLTLRAYHAHGGLFADPASAKLPTIEQGACK